MVGTGVLAAGKQLLKGKAQKEADRQEVVAQLDEASRAYDPEDYELPTLDLLNNSESYDVDELSKEVKAAISNKCTTLNSSKKAKDLAGQRLQN